MVLAQSKLLSGDGAVSPEQELLKTVQFAVHLGRDFRIVGVLTRHALVNRDDGVSESSDVRVQCTSPLGSDFNKYQIMLCCVNPCRS